MVRMVVIFLSFLLFGIGIWVWSSFSSFNTCVPSCAILYTLSVNLAVIYLFVFVFVLFVLLFIYPFC